MDSLSFGDVFTKSFVAMQGGMERFSALDIVVNLGATFLLGLFIFYVYRRTFRGVLYQRSFNVALVAISMVVTMVIMTISGNLVLSLGMVGALSIVRFRTPIKDPIDLVFIFWAIAVGIANGVGYFNLSVIGSIILTMVLFVMTRKSEDDQPYLLVMLLPNEADEGEVVSIVKKSVGVFSLKSKTITGAGCEVTAEIRLNKDADTGFINELHANMNVDKVTLITYSGELAQA